MGKKRKEIYYTIDSNGRHFKTKTPKHMLPPQHIMIEEDVKDDKIKQIDTRLRKFSRRLDLVASACFLLVLFAICMAVPIAFVGGFFGIFFPNWLVFLLQVFTGIGVLNAIIKWFINTAWEYFMEL